MNGVVELTIYYFKNSATNDETFAAFLDDGFIEGFMEKFNFDLFRKISKKYKDLS